MKLKNMEISGFKSFVDQTRIEFPPGISAVVGPNGCGKSNVVDALMWAMGEQSVKQLRGKSMEDVIFSGTNGKPPVNMAEVSLTLINDNGTVPEELKDYTEIMLTRRLYRSGESAYFINKQPCRLKDIHSIFMGSGMGPKSYAVVQQGYISQITDAGPEEIRFFIEEAAGITRYKTRKKETLRKIHYTNQNLLRVTDIIAEIKRQMAGLKRQARKAERYKKNQDRIRELDICIALYHYDEYTQKIEETDALIRNLEDTDIEHTSKLKKLDAAVEKIKFQRSQKNQEISDLKSRRFEAQRNIDRVENDLVHTRKGLESLTYDLKGLETARKDLEEKNRNLKSEVADVEIQSEKIDSQIETVTLNLDKEKSASQKTKDKLSALNQKLESRKANLMDLVAQEAQYKNIYHNITANKESLQRRLKATDNEIVATSQKVKKLKKKKDNAEEKLDSHRIEINDLDIRIDTIQKNLREKNQYLSEQIKNVHTLELERNKDRSAYSTLKKMEDNFEWYKDGVRAVMKKRDFKNARKPGELKSSVGNGIIGLMADVIEPEPSFETAVEAVLGESLQYIIIHDQKVGVDSIDYLQTTGAGRSGFIPISSFKKIDIGCHELPDPGKRLLDHVTVKQGFEKITEALLGDVVIAADIGEAIRVFNNNGSLQTVVTLDGDVISNNGIMIGGSKDNLSGILVKKQEIKKIAHRIKSLDKKIESAQNDQRKLESEVRSIESDMQKLLELRNKTAQNEVEAEKDLYKVTEDLKHARRHLEIVNLEQEQLLGEKSDIDEEMDKYNRAVSEIENDVQTAQNKVSEKIEHINSLSSEMDNFNQKIVDIKLKMTALNANLENSDDTLRRLKEFQSDGVKQLEQLSLEIYQKQQKSISSKHKIREYEQILSDLYDDMKRLEQTFERNEADYNAIDARLNDSDSIKSDIQGKREETLQKIRLLELEHSERNIKRESIANRLEESYHNPITVLKTEYSEISNNKEFYIDEMENELFMLRKKIANIDDVNLGAITEYEQLKERFNFLNEQRDDLVRAVDDLHKVIKKINKITKKRFLETLEAINNKLNEVFPPLFEGGSAKLLLTEPENPLETGVEFMIHPPGKKITRMSLLSGGEKALSAIALIFSIFLLRPASFCFMDEIDAPLDDANLFRFNDLLQIIGEKSQIIMITHNKRTMEFADTLFGITMENKGISKIVSVNFQHEGK
jgi:chromosome segregation protein